MTNITNKRRYFVIYTISFAILMFLIFFEYIFTGTTLINAKDGLAQYYPYMLKVKDFYESLFGSLFLGDSIELVDFNAYFGLDSISSYNYYGLGNPLYLLTMGWPVRLMPYVYSGLAILKIYLAGISFSFLCFHYKKPYFSTLLGAFMYLLSPIVIGCLSHMIFMDIFYQFPLLIMGFNKILKGEKSPLFILAVTLSALNGYYFLYMMTIMIAVYGIIMVFRNNTGIKKVISNGLGRLASTSIHYIIGLMLAAPTFIPAIIGFLSSYRTSTISADTLNLLYDADYYLKQLSLIIIYSSNSLRINILIIFIGILLIRTKSKEYTLCKTIILLCIIGAQLPFVGSMMNGFSYPSNRWLFCLYLLISVIAVDLFDSFINTASDKKPRYLIVTAVFAFTIIQTAFINHYSATSCATADEIYELATATTVEEIESKSRIDGDTNWRDNTSLFYDIQKTQFYISTLPGKLLSTHISLDVPTVDNTNEIQGLDSRTELEALFNIEYFLTKNANENIPYGFREIETASEDKYLYKNDYLLPFGYTYDSYVKSSAISKFNGIDRSWTYMDHAVIGDSDISSISTNQTTFVESTCISVPISTTTDSGGNISISFDEITNSEVYVKLSTTANVDGKYLFITGDETTSYFTVKNPNSNWYVPKDYEIFNAGYFDSISELTIKCNYACDDIEIYYHPIDNYAEQIASLSEYHLENVKWSANKISGTISVPDNRIMCLSVPRLDGWTAYVDGEETQILTVNGLFMGLDLEPGNHIIEFRYFTPGLKEGLVIFIVGIIGFVASLIKTPFSTCKSHQNHGVKTS